MSSKFKSILTDCRSLGRAALMVSGVFLLAEPFVWAQNSLFPQTVVFSDDFNRPDSSAVGRNWVPTVNGPGGSVSILDNRLRITSHNTGTGFLTHELNQHNSILVTAEFMVDSWAQGSQFGVWILQDDAPADTSEGEAA